MVLVGVSLWFVSIVWLEISCMLMWLLLVGMRWVWKLVVLDSRMLVNWVLV